MSSGIHPDVVFEIATDDAHSPAPPANSLGTKDGAGEQESAQNRPWNEISVRTILAMRAGLSTLGFSNLLLSLIADTGLTSVCLNQYYS